MLHLQAHRIYSVNIPVKEWDPQAERAVGLRPGAPHGEQGGVHQP